MSIVLFKGVAWGVEKIVLASGAGTSQPRVLSAVPQDPNHVRVTFDREINFGINPDSTALLLSSYSIERISDSEPLQVLLVEEVSGTVVDLTTIDQEAVDYRLTVNSAVDVWGNDIDPAYDTADFIGDAPVYPDLEDVGAFIGMSSGMQHELNADILPDIEAPYLINKSPLATTTGNSKSTNISVDVVDDRDRLDPATVQIWVEGSLAYEGSTNTFQPGFDGVGSIRTPVTNGYRYTIDPTGDFSDYQVVDVRARAGDLADPDVLWVDESWWFGIEGTIPTSDEWPCLDMQPVSMPGLLIMDITSYSRGAPYITLDGNDDQVMYSDDGLPTWVRLDLPISQKFTFEANFKPSVLPENLDETDKYNFFIGGFDKQDNGAGLLISRAGLAIVASIGSSAVVIPGSQNIFEEGETYFTMRVVVDGSTDTMNVYITKTSELLTTGHVLRYTSPAPVTPAGVLDSLFLQVTGQSTRAVTLKLDSIHCHCTALKIPNERPIADPGADQAANIGSAVVHDGRNSYDPEGAPLTYEWALVDAPDGSRYKTSGTGGSTYPDVDLDDFTDIFVGGTDAFSSDNAPLLQPGDTLIVQGVVYKISTDRWDWDAATGKYVRGTGWNDDEVRITTDTLPDNLSNVSWQVFHTATYFTDPLQPFPSAIPDVTGIYRVQLIVNDGELDSLPATSLLNVASTTVPLGCIPDVSWVWNHLTDFWRFVTDKDKIETIWSGFAQACAAQLLTAWQIDYNKSLLDIQRVFQRRWLGYDTIVNDDPEEATIRIIRGSLWGESDLAAGANVDGETLQLVLDDGSIETVTFSGANPISAETIAAQINQQMGFQNSPTPLAVVYTVGAAKYLALEYGMLLRVRPVGTANTDLGFSTTEYTQNDLQGTTGRAVSASRLDAFVTEDNPWVLDFTVEGVQRLDLLVRDGEAYRIQKVASDGATPASNRALTLLDSLPEGATTDDAWLVPCVVRSQIVDYETELVVVGDIARFELKDLTTGEISEVHCEVVGVNGKTVGFNPLQLLQAYDGQPSNFNTWFLGVKRIHNIPVDELVEDIPRLQEIVKNPPSWLSQNVDFYIDNTLGTNAIRFKSGTFTLNDPPPDTFWAEITYLDNKPNIEANFGRLVNFKVEDLTTRSDDLDYLSAVRGLWWAYFGGPSLYKVRVGTQILLGLPFSEEFGTVESIEPNFSATEGRIIIRDIVNDSIVRTYFYPKAAGLAVNELTGATIAEGDTVEQFAPLSLGIEVLDWREDPDWFVKYIRMGAMEELHKYFRFLIRGDVDTFNVANIAFAVDFVKKIKPHYTHPLFVLLKNLPPDEVDVLDDIWFHVTLKLWDSSCPDQTGAYRYDDTDEEGNWTHFYDATVMPDKFLYDRQRLCPSELIWAVMAYVHPGGAGWFYDTIWAYDDGDTDGDLVSDDILPLSGPDSSPPAPYGPLVGVIEYDDTVAAGKYWRTKYL
jgi:hypothetical protein